MQMVTFMRANGKTTRPMVMAATLTLMELLTLVSGKTTNNTAKVLRPGQMEPSTRVSTSKARSMARAL